jgi:hypothetical protein
VPLAEPHHAVVDGSNLATEGRTSPSLKQLDEAVRAYASEDPAANIIVVVDATFEHRVSDAEREEVRLAMLNGEIISPPAGAIGRGDAFVLRIAERTGATVLSNDSFQEFHGEHPWLFDDGRLIGGKPVPGVGWIFTPRLPIRGPKSRAATAEAKSKKRDDPESAPAKAAELARAAKKAAKKSSRAKKTTRKAPPVDTSWPLKPSSPPPGRGPVDPVVSSAIDEAVEEALHPPTAARGAAKKSAPTRSAKEKKDSGEEKRSGGRRTEPNPQADRSDKKKKRTPPPPAVNEPLAFINFVAAFAVGSTLQGEVVSFTSHGAMVDVDLPVGGVLHCYIPLTAMGQPPPTKARQVLKKGEVRSFVLAGLDPPRRVAELALSPATPAGPVVPGRKASAAKAAAPVRESGSRTAAAPAKKTARKAVKKAAKKAAKQPVAPAAKKKAAKKVAPAAKHAPVKQQPAKKAPAKKADKASKAPKKAKATTAAKATKAPAKKATKARRS